MKKVIKKEKGFTIIEVVLVLAIAGLIFMVVFLAVPGLQRGQRDTQRKQDLGRLISTITSYQSNNKGVIPRDSTVYNANTTGNEGAIYLELISGGSRYSDPSTQEPYVVTSVSEGDESVFQLDKVGEISIIINGSCADTVILTAPFKGNAGNDNASFAAAMRTEGGVYCQNG